MNKIQNTEAMNAMLALGNIIHEHFGKDLFGMYIYGSAIGKDFNNELSDLDILVVVGRLVDDAILNELEDIHHLFSTTNPAWKDRLDIAYISAESAGNIKDTPYAAAIKWYESPFLIVKSADHWLIDWYKIQNQGITLFGKAPTEVMPFITKQEFREVIKCYILGWPANMPTKTEQTDLAYVALTMSRSLYAYIHCENISKTKSAEWMMQEYPKYKKLLAMSLKLSRSKDEKTNLVMQKQVTELVDFVCLNVNEN
jgi:predicted nucleotidyltransferase